MEPKGLQTFKKAERITSKLLIDRLFNGEGSSMVVFPFRVVYIKVPKVEVPVSILVSVPKKRLHKAVDRNRMKRLTREAYRRQKQILWNALEQLDSSVAIAFVYLAPNLCTYEMVCKSMNKILTRIANVA